MSLTPILAVTQMTQSQANKDVTVNDLLKALELSRGYLAFSVAGGAGTQQATAAQARYGVLELTGVLTGNRTLNIPTGFDHSLVLLNNTTGAFTLSVTWNAGTAQGLPRGCAVPIRKNAGATAFDLRGMVKLPEVVAYRNTSTQALTLNAETPIQFNAEERDTAEAFDSTTNWRFTAPVACLVHVNSAVEFDITGTLAGQNNSHIAIRKNGTVLRRGSQTFPGAFGTATFRGTVSGLLQLAASDTVDVVFANALTAGTIVANFGIEKTYFELFTIRLGT